MTDNDIIKALECMASVNENGLCYAEQENIKRMKEGKPYIVCSNIKDEKFECCPHYQEPFDTCMDDGSHQKALQSALDIITRQKAEIERLKKYDEERDIRLHAKLISTARTEAIKEFAERLKSQMKFNYDDELTAYDIDSLVSEMVGERE